MRQLFSGTVVFEIMVMVKILSGGTTRVAFLESRVYLQPSDVARLRRDSRDFDRHDRQTAKFDINESCIRRSWLHSLIAKSQDQISMMFFFCSGYTVTRTPWISMPILQGVWPEHAGSTDFSRRKRHRRVTSGENQRVSMLCTQTRMIEVKMKIVRTPVVVNVEMHTTPLSDGRCFVRMVAMNLRLPISSG
eukprot:SAG31_NODE_9891_length_1215_cov_1.230287_2_plen_190_part_01